MQGLLIKDLLANIKAFRTFGLFAAIIGLFGIIVPFQENYDPTNLSFIGVMLPTMIFIGGGEAFSSTIFRRDESKRWAYYISSSPFGAKGQVDSKYLFLIAMTFVFSLVCLIYDSIMVTVHKDYVSVAGMIYVLSVMQLFLRALDTPFILRWGYEKGVMVKTCILLALILVVIVYLLFGDLSIFDSFGDIWGDLAETLSDPTAFMTKLLGIMGLVSIVSFYISYKISCKIYPKGVECIEQ